MRNEMANLIPKEKALELLFAEWSPIPHVETVPLEEAAGRVLAEDQYSGYDLPVYRASTMDGIAVRSADFASGLPDTARWRLGQDFVRADTGDDFDDAFDAVIAIENVTLPDDGGVLLAENTEVKPGSNVKPQGRDVQKGSLLCAKGTVLTALDLAAIGMGGQAAVPVIRKPRVAFLPTGSELVPVGTELKRGQNFDTNSLMAAQLIRDMGGEPFIHPIVRDDLDTLQTVLSQMLESADIVIVNAGTSKGGEDYGTRLLDTEGTLLFHGVAAVPGRPMSMAVIHNTPVVNLSGPTFACFYSMDWAVRAMVCRFLGIDIPKRKTVRAVLTKPLRSPPVLSVMMSVKLEQSEDGRLLATPLSLRGPGAVGAAAALTADAVYVTRLGGEQYDAGSVIEVELLH